MLVRGIQDLQEPRQSQWSLFSNAGTGSQPQRVASAFRLRLNWTATKTLSRTSVAAPDKTRNRRNGMSGSVAGYLAPGINGKEY